MKKYFEKKIVARQQRWAGEYVVPDHTLFWEISVTETSTTERWGAPGTKGDSQTMHWHSSQDALQIAEELIVEKERLGYKAKPVPEELEEPPGRFAVKRYFEKFNDFWELRIIGRSVCERFGVVGTWGDSEVSVLASFEEALKLGKDLKDKKLKDGYLELPIPAPTPVEDDDGNPAPPHLRFYGRVDAAIEARFLECLDEARKRGPEDGYYFNPPASMETIAALESSNRVVLPKSLRKFLLCFDGGFIWRRKGRSIDLFQDHSDFANKSEIEQIDLKRGVSFSIQSAGEIVKGHIWPGTLSFCDTWNEEVLTVWSMHQPHQESPIFDAFHESEVNEWRILYPSFAHLFIDYVENQGLIETGWEME